MARLPFRGLAAVPLLTALLLAAASSAAAQQKRLTLTGTVLDSVTGAPVAAALVRLQERGRTVLTDSLGRFAFRDLAPGTYTVLATGLGYGERSAQVSLAEAAVALRLPLPARPYTLSPLLAIDSAQAPTLGCWSWRRIRYVAIGPQALAAGGDRDLQEFVDSLSWTRGPFQVVYHRLAHGEAIVYFNDALQYPLPSRLDWLRPRGLARMELYDNRDRGPNVVRLYTAEYLQSQARDPLTLLWLCPENRFLLTEVGTQPSPVIRVVRTDRPVETRPGNADTRVAH